MKKLIKLFQLSLTILFIFIGFSITNTKAQTTVNNGGVTIYPMRAYLNAYTEKDRDLPFSSKVNLYYPDRTALLQGDNLFFAVEFKGGPIAGDKKLFIYLVNKNNEVKFKTTINPQVPTSKWWNGVTLVSSLIKLPDDIPVDLYDVYTGLYDGVDENSKVTLNPGSGTLFSSFKSDYVPKVIADGQRYKVGTLNIVSNPNNKFLKNNCDIPYNCTSYNKFFNENYSSGTEYGRRPIDRLTINKISSAKQSIPAGSVFSFDINFSGGPAFINKNMEMPIYLVLIDDNNNIALRLQIEPSPYPPSKWKGNVKIPVSIRIPENIKSGNYSIRYIANIDLFNYVFITGDGVTEYYQGTLPNYEIGKLNITNSVGGTNDLAYSSKLPSVSAWTGPDSASRGSVINALLNFNTVPTRYQYGAKTWQSGNLYGLSKDINASLYVKLVNSTNEAKVYYLSNINPPTSEWKVGKLSIPVNISIPDDTPVGTYKVYAGLYGIVGVDAEVGKINITNNSVSNSSDTSNLSILPIDFKKQEQKITINKLKLYDSSTNIPLSTSKSLSTITIGVNFVGGPTDGDKRVFVHFVDSSGNIKFLADIAPSTPSSKWTASSNNWITTDIDIPENIPVGNYNVYAGLYSMDTGVKLNPGSEVSEVGQLRYKIGSINIVNPVTSINFSQKLMTGGILNAIASFFNY